MSGTIRILVLIGAYLSTCGAAFAESHVLTATGARWIYRDDLSGDGEAGAVRIFAAAGDTVTFRQTHGRHGVFFYRTPPGRTELGRRIVVDADFAVIGDRQALKRLSNRLFRRENLATPEFAGARTIVSIKLGKKFRTPLYFGCRVHSVLNRGAMFGAIIPSSGRKQPKLVKPANLRGARQVLATWFEPESPRFDLGVLKHLPGRKVFVVRGRQFYAVDKNRLDNPPDDAAKYLESWFGNDTQTAALRPDRARWLYATSVDLDLDNDLDVVALIRLDNQSPAWWVLRNSYARGVFTSVRVDRIDRNDAPRFAAGAFAMPVDVNNDSRPDLILSYGGAREGRLEVFLNQRQEFRFRRQSSLRFQLRQSIDANRAAKVSNIGLIYPFDGDFDGWTDLVVAGREGGCAVFLNSPEGFQSRAKILPGLPFPVRKIALQDVNHDRRSDLLLEGKPGTLRVSLNGGSGKFTPAN